MGNYNQIGCNFESTGVASGSVAYRIAFNTERGKLFRDHAYESNQEFAFGLLCKLSDHSDLNFTFNYVDQELGGHLLGGVPVDEDGNFILPISFNTNEPADFQNMDAKVLQSILNHSFNDSLRMRMGIRYLTNKRSQQYHEPRGFITGSITTMER